MKALLVFFSAIAIGFALPQRRPSNGGALVFPGATVARQGSQAQGGGGCKSIEECPSLVKLLRDDPKKLGEFEQCGFEEGRTLFSCPRSMIDHPCNCKRVKDCPELDALARMKDFETLRKKERCGFDADQSMPMYCCPEPDFMKKRVKVSNGPDVSTILRSDTFNNRMEAFYDENASNCGRDDQPRIIGGQDAQDHEFPWAVVLAYVDASNDSTMYLCGGSLVSPQYVLTAAHCIRSRGGHHLRRVRLGHSNRTHEETFDVDIEHVSIHPDFESHPILYNDLALLRLVRPVEETFDSKGNVKTRPICLAREDDEILDPVVVGWGLVDRENATTILQKLNLDAVENLDCEDQYRARVTGFFVEDTQVCASGVAGTDSCKGDSGGPLMYLSDDGRWRQAGITSFGTNKCDSSLPGIYTRVSKFREWIAMVATHEPEE